MAKLFVVGLTGPTGAGKSEAARVFAEQGCAVIDADVLSRRAVEKGSLCLDALAHHFSESILNSDGTLNRKALAAVAFSSPERTQLLNRVVHPAVIRMTEEALVCAQAQGKAVAVIDAPLLFQAGLDSICDVTVAVLAPSQVRLQRICVRDGLTEEQAQTRMRAQPDEAYYADHATHTVWNTDDRAVLREQVQSLWEQWRGRWCE